MYRSLIESTQLNSTLLVRVDSTFSVRVNEFNSTTQLKREDSPKKEYSPKREDSAKRESPSSTEVDILKAEMATMTAMLLKIQKQLGTLSV